MRVQEVLYFSTEKYFESVVEAIHRSKTEILIETYIFRKGRISRALFSALIAARNRGVRIKLCVDAAGVYGQTGELWAFCEKNSFELRIFHPILWTDLIKSFKFLNRRNHRKMFIIDAQMAFISSINISDAHIEKNDKGYFWKDYGISIEGTSVQILVSTFFRSFNKFQFKKNISQILKGFEHNHLESGILLNDTLVKRHEWTRHLKEKIQKATSRIWIANPYIVPKFQIQKHLEDAAKRGVDVKILTSGSSSDVFFMPWLMSLYYERNLKAGIELYEYLASFFHGKVLVIDDALSIGTSNMNHRSILHDLEVEVQVFNENNKKLVLEDLKKCFLNSKRVTQSDFQKIPFWKKSLARLLYLFKYWF